MHQFFASYMRFWLAEEMYLLLLLVFPVCVETFILAGLGGSEDFFLDDLERSLFVDSGKKPASGSLTYVLSIRLVTFWTTLTFMVVLKSLKESN